MHVAVNMVHLLHLIRICATEVTLIALYISPSGIIIIMIINQSSERYTHRQPTVDTSCMELVRTLEYTQPVPVLVFTDADVALGYQLAGAELGRRVHFGRQLVNVTRLQATRNFTHVLNQVQQMLTEQHQKRQK